MFDFVVVGGGVAGCSIAYFLSKAGHKVAVVEYSDICSGASVEVGAFINPNMRKPSNLKTFADKSFAFASEYFSANFPHIFKQCGTYLLPKTEKSTEEYLALEPFIEFEHEYLHQDKLNFLTPEAGKFGAYLCKSSGVVPPKEFCEMLVSDCELFCNTEVSMIEKADDGFSVASVRAKAVIIATGAHSELVEQEYIKRAIVGLWGQKIVVDTHNKLDSNVSGEVLVSATNGGKVAIGATYTRSPVELPLSDENSKTLIAEARAMVDIEIGDIVDVKGGLRATSIDHFPIVGKIIDSAKTIQLHPDVRHGRRLKSEQVSYLDNIYIFTGHTSKAFSVAFYSAKIFAEYLEGQGILPASIDSDRLFYRWCRKNTV